MGINIGIGNYIGKGNSKQSYSLILDYTFDKSNFDIDRNKVYNKLNPNEYIELKNFGFSLNSGYGLFTENYLTYRKVENVFVTDDHSVTIMNFVPANTWVLFKYGTEHLNTTRVRVTGLTANNQLAYGYSVTNDGARVLMTIPSDGEYDLPESVVNATSYNIGFIVQNALTKNVTIEQIPEYPNHLVFDGVDDYTSSIPNFNVNEGTIIVQYNPIDTDAVKMLSNGETGTYYAYTFFIGNVSIQSIGADSTTRVEIPINAEGTISAFAYDSTGINLFSNGIFKTSNHVNSKYQYAFGKDWNSAKYGKLALKRIKVFNKKLTEELIREEYDKLKSEL